MAASAGTVTLDLDANSVKLLRELQKASRKTQTTGQKMQRNMTRAFKNIARAAARLGPALAVGLTGLAAAGVRSADSLAKTADKLGIAADELAGLQFAAQQTGVKIEALNMGLQRMVRRIAEAATGTGEAKAALKELGLDAKALAQLTPDEQFRMVAEAMQKVEGEAHKVRLSFKLFDSEGVALKNTLTGGSEQLIRFREEAERMGLALSEGQLKNIQEAAEAQGRVASAFKGLTQQLAANFAPAMELAANKTVGFLTSITNSLPGLTAYWSRIFGIRREIDRLSDTGISAEIEQLDIAVLNKQGEIYERGKSLAERLGQVFNVNLSSGMAGAASSAFAQFQDSPKMQQLKFELDELQKRYTEAVVLRNKLKDPDGNGGGVLSMFTPSDAQIARQREANDLFAAASMDLDGFIARQEKIEALGATMFDRTRTGIQRYMIAMADAQAALTAGVVEGGLDTFQAYRRILKDELIPDLEDLEDTTKDVTDNMSEYSKQAARNMQDAFAEFLFDPFEDGLQGMLKSFLETMRRMLANKVAASVFDWLGVKIPFFGERAMGGPVSAGTPYLVGERGPEVMVPSTSGNIVPNHKLGGSVSVVYNIDARGVDEARVLSTIFPMLERTKEMTKSEVRQEMRQGRFA